MPCNFHLRRLAEKVKEGVRAAGGTPMEFNTVAISDGITMGTEGMKTSLVSREVIADSIELVARGHMFDAVVALSGCDKTIPGCVMALARLDVPSLMLYGGSIAPGRWRGKDVTIQDVFEAIGAHAAGDLTDEELTDLENHACPGAGACGGQFTANTMAMAFEVLGISPMGSSMVPAEDGKKGKVAEECGRLVMEVLDAGPAAEPDHHQGVARERDRRPGRCRAARPTLVLHLLAVANEAGRAARHRRLRPHRLGHAAAVRPQAGRPLRRHRPLPRRRRAARDPRGCRRPACSHGDALTVTGQTIGEVADARRGGRGPGRRPAASTTRSSPTAASRSCAATSRRRAASSSSSGHGRTEHRGPARVFESEEDAFAAVMAKSIQPGEVVVIRNEGPVGGPGMREMLARDRRARGGGPRRFGRAAHRRPLLGRHPRLHGRPRRPGGAARRPDRRGRATATRSSSTSPSASSTSS